MPSMCRPRASERAGLLLCVALASPWLASCGDPAGAPTVVTVEGEVVGLANYRGVEAYLGIPYAEPPVGALRFAPPVAHGPFDGPVDATRYGFTCPQIADENENASTLPQSEDCLTLNVFRPRSAARELPVLVFLHGGAWLSGGTADPWYDGAALAARGDIVVVTVNYRLGALGFLDLGGVDPSLASSPVAGLLDQREALRWIQRNIAAFGGDPGAVTLWGQSAGSMSTLAHLASPGSAGLFHRAILESGAGNLYRSTAVGRAIAQTFLETAGVTDVAGLRALSSERMMEVQEAVLENAVVRDTVFAPSLDGTVLPADPLVALRAGQAADVPVLIGTVRDETRYWLYYLPYFMAVQPTFFLNIFPWIGDVANPRESTLVAGYTARNTGIESWEVTMRIANDAMFRVPSLRVADALAGHADVYLYRFDWRTTIDGGIYGAPHGVDLPFVFGNRAEGLDFTGDDAPVSVSEQMMDAWIAFAKTGNPGHAGLPSWPTYDPTTRPSMAFDVTPSLVNDPDGADVAEWDGIAFDSITPTVDPFRPISP